MTVARAGHTATLLLDGKVLIAGGNSPLPLAGNPEALSSAELYDPSTGTFAATGYLTTGRRMHTATLLPDGRVLIVSGYGSAGSLASAELYDPATGTFAPTGNLITPQGWHTATLLNNGKVLIAGGFTKWPALANAELYDPATGTFAAAGSYANTAYACDFCPPATRLPDGKVLFAGTQPPQLYDPVINAFTAVGAMLHPDAATATLLTNGKVLFTGGGFSGRSSDADLYDPASSTFTSAPNMGWRRGWHTSTLLPDGTALIAAGESEDCAANSCFFSGSLATSELYNPSTGGFASTGSLGARRGGHTATLLNDGRVLITGGVSYGGIGLFFGSLASAEIYHPAVLAPAPVLFSMSGGGRGQGAVLHAGTSEVASSGHPAVAEEALEIYCTGLADGSVIPPQVAIGGRMAEVLWFGKVPDFPNLSQVNVRVPSGVTPGPAVPVRLTYLSRPSNEVTIGVR
jgi:hypothetical protein